MTDKARVTEIAPDLYAISIYVPEFNLRFNHFLIKDDEPLLFHTGMKQMFPLVRDAVARVIDPSTLRWISFSHFEADECGALNEWLGVAPHAKPVCGLVGALVSVNDFSIRPARVLAHEEVLNTGKCRLQLRQTPHVPHNWEASLLFEEVTRTLLCSDLFTHKGDVEAATESDIVGRAKASLIEDQKGPFAQRLSLYAVDWPDPARIGRSSSDTVGAHAWFCIRGKRRTGIARLGGHPAGGSGARHGETVRVSSMRS